MRNLLALVGLLVIGVGGLGWYMGWYKLSFTRNTDGNIQIQTDVDTKKVSTDSSEALKNLGAAIGTHVQKAAQDAKTTAPTNAPPGGTPGPVTPPQNANPNPVTPTGGIEPIPPVAPPTPAPPGSAPNPIPLVPPG